LPSSEQERWEPVYASKFFDATPCSTVLVARDLRYDRLRKEGSTVNGKRYLVPVVHPDEPFRPCDLVIVAPKNHNLVVAVPDLKNLVGDQTTIISVMNRLDS
jgi:2-dehydropantoate 2-reductase